MFNRMVYPSPTKAFHYSNKYDFFFQLNVVSHPCFPSVFPKFSLCYYSDLSCVIEVDHYGQFVRKARTKTCKASTDPVWDQVRGGKLDF